MINFILRIINESLNNNANNFSPNIIQQDQVIYTQNINFFHEIKDKYLNFLNYSPNFPYFSNDSNSFGNFSTKDIITKNFPNNLNYNKTKQNNSDIPEKIGNFSQSKIHEKSLNLEKIIKEKTKNLKNKKIYENKSKKKLNGLISSICKQNNFANGSKHFSIRTIENIGKIDSFT